MKIAVHRTNRCVVSFNLCLCAIALSVVCASAQTSPPTNNLVMWLKADSLALADGAAVNFWGDSSGNGHDGVVLPTWNAPTFAANGINGHPAVLFSSNSRALFVTNNVSPITQTLRLQTGLTFAASFKTFDTSSPIQTPNWTANPILADNTGSFTAFAFGISGGTGQYKHYDAGWQSISGSTDVANTNVYPGHSLITTHNSTSGLAELYADGIFQGSKTIGYYSFTGLNMIGNQSGGSPDHFRGHIGEILVYSIALSTADRLQLQTYLTELALDIPEPSAILLLLIGAVLLRRKH